jgi:hypothetical protein
MSRAQIQTDEQLAAMDIPAAIARGVRSGEITIAAAVRADQIGVQPRSIEFLAEVVRRGGVSYAARLPQPLPGEEQSALVRPWLAAAGEDGTTFARWLDAVATAVSARRAARLTGQ